MKISSRLMLGATLLTVVSVIGSAGTTGWLALRDSSRAIEDSLEKQFQAIASSRDDAVTRLFEGYNDLLHSLANGRMTQEALYGFVRPFDSYRYEVPYMDPEALRGELEPWYREVLASHYRQTSGERAPTKQWLDSMAYEAQLLQRRYLADNPEALVRPEALTDADDGTIYGQQHKKYHASFRDLVQRFGFNDLMLVDRSGERIIYSVRKAPHLGTSLKTGPFSQSALAELIASLREEPDELKVSRFGEATYRYGEPVVYMALSVRHDSLSPDRPTGYLVAEIPARTLTAAVTLNSRWHELGLGETGQAFLVSPSGERVTDPRSDNFPDQLRQLQPVRAALNGEDGIGQAEDGQGRPQLYAWQPVRLGEQDYALIVQQSPDEVFAELNTLRNNIWASAIGVSVVLLALALLVAWVFARLLSRPLTQLATDIDLATRDRDLTQSFDTTRTDEIGAISRSLSTLFSSLRETLSEVNEATSHAANTAQDNAAISAQCRQEADKQRREVSSLDAAISQTGNALEGISGELTDVSRSVEEAAELAKQGRNQVGDVARQVEALRQQIFHSDESMEELTHAADSIVAVVDTIRSVAEQTNLLALNAAIEAARAGEHGRGFAVVADEVRRLSASTHEATGEIQALVDRLRQTVTHTAQGLKAEQDSAQSCSEQSREAETALATIYETVHHAQRTTEGLQSRSQQERNRAGELHRRLESMVAIVEETDGAIARLADSAASQQRMTERTLSLTRQIRLS